MGNFPIVRRRCLLVALWHHSHRLLGPLLVKLWRTGFVILCSADSESYPFGRDPVTRNILPKTSDKFKTASRKFHRYILSLEFFDDIFLSNQRCVTFLRNIQVSTVQATLIFNQVGWSNTLLHRAYLPRISANTCRSGASFVYLKVATLLTLLPIIVNPNSVSLWYTTTWTWRAMTIPPLTPLCDQCKFTHLLYLTERRSYELTCHREIYFEHLRGM